MNKKVLRTKEQADVSIPTHLDDADDMSSSEDERGMNALTGRNRHASQFNPTGSERKKPRIPWDRNPHGDKNGLKMALLSVVNDNAFHVEGGLMDNFREVSRILSQPGSKFEKYEGIEPSGAQRKFNAILKEVATSYRLTDSGEFEGEEAAEGFEALSIKMLKDIIQKEKAKYTNSGVKAARVEHLLNTSAASEELGLTNSNASVDDIDPHLSHHAHAGGDLNFSTSFLKKRKAEITPLKHALKRVAVAGVAPEHTEEDSLDRGINRLDDRTHLRVLAELQKMNIHTVEDLFKAADISPQGVQQFYEVTQVKLNKPVNRMLKLYEEVAVAKDFVSQMHSLCGLSANDALELEEFVKPIYLANRN